MQHNVTTLSVVNYSTVLQIIKTFLCMFAQSHSKKGVARYLLLFAKTDILFLENRIHYDLLVRQGPACLCVPGERMTGVAVAAVMSEIF